MLRAGCGPSGESLVDVAVEAAAGEFESGRLERDDGRGRPSAVLASAGQLVSLCLREPHGDAERALG